MIPKRPSDSLLPSAPEWDPGAGYRWAVVASPSWLADPRLVKSRSCRYGSPWRGYCGEDAVAVVDRARPERQRRGEHSWYGYCAEHLYGQWIENGIVVRWSIVRE